MASIRKLKKDIQFLSAEVIGDCINIIDALNNEKNDQVWIIIEETVKLHNSVMERACHPDGKDNPKMVKQYYKQLRSDFIQGLDKSYSKLEGLIKAAS